MSYVTRVFQVAHGYIRSFRIWSRGPRAILLYACVVAFALFTWVTARMVVSPPTISRAHTTKAPKQITDFDIILALYVPFPFIWNYVTDPPPSSPGVSYLPLLARQTNCSLTRQVLDPSLNFEPQYTYPNYQDYVRQGVGLPSTGDKWPNGCSQPSTGVGGQNLVVTGKLSNGNAQIAVVNWPGLLAASTSQNLVTATLDTATGQAVSPVTYPLVSSSYTTVTLATADLNGDGINDIVVVSLQADTSTSGEVSVLLGKSDGTFQPVQNTPINVAATSVTLDDMNGDGKLDLVVTGVATPGVAVLLGKGNGTLGDEIDGPSGASGQSAATADLNGDGKKDVALSSGQILLGKGDGTLDLLPGTLSTVAPTGGNPDVGKGIAAADFNKDGVVDLAVANGLTATVDIYLGQGDGTFTYKYSFASLYGQQSIQATDIDGDGNPDLFIGTSSGGVFLTDAYTGGIFESALGNGDGTFHSAGDAYLPNNPGQQFITFFDLADFNGDSKPDIVSIDVDATNTTPQLRVRDGSSDGKFTELASTAINVPGLTGGQSNTSALVAADLNGDAKQDVVFATTPLGSSNSTISVAAGNGDGTFAAQADYPSPGVVLALVVADINGDGKPDIVFVSDPSNQGVADLTHTVIEAMLNKGNGIFQAAQPISPQANLQALTVADVNGDGKQDLVVSTSNGFTSSTGNVLVYLGNGDGTFQNPSSLSAGTYPGPVTIADMNNDGHLDIVVYTTDSNSSPLLDILLGNGDGTFQTATSSQLPQNVVTGLAVADMNGDKKPDVVLTACCGLANTMVALGNGDGTIIGAAIVYEGISSNLIKLADINGDGLPDILLTSNLLSIDALLSTASASSGFPTSTTVTASATSISVGQPVTFTVQVTSADGNAPPGGSVTFSDGSTTLSTQTLSATGSATYMTSSLIAGTHSISAAYAGNTTFAASSSSPVTITVSASTLVGTTTMLTATPTTSAAGGNVAFNAVVAAISGTTSPTGTVTFSDGATALGTGTLDATGKTTFSSSTLAVGAHSIAAAYGGSAAFSPSTSTAATVTITAAAQDYGIALAKSSGTIAYGTTGTITDGITITSINGFSQRVTVSCTGAPQYSTCTVNPTSVTPSASTPGTTTLSIMTNVATSAVAMPSTPSHSRGKTTLAFLGGGVFFAFSLMRIRRTRWHLTQLCLVLCFLICSALVGCGGGSSGSGGSGNNTPKGSYPITVTAAAGATTHTTSFSLTIQ
jgi:Bacterial Ig-like domain (group 3)/FG-GAP-like repeat